jgi:hypothetical protein
MEADHPKTLTDATSGLIVGSTRAIRSLGDAVDSLVSTAPERELLETVQTRGHFRPTEEEELLAWFARFLTVREGLWEVLEEVSRPVDGRISRVLDNLGWCCFVLGYTAACLIVRIDRLLLEEIATSSPTQRKLNEGSIEHRIPRKQYTAIFESFTDPEKAQQMDRAMRFAKRQRRRLSELQDDVLVGDLVAQLEDREKALDPSRRRYFSRLLAFISHSWRRRSASTRQRLVFGALEASGRVVSELRDHWSPDRVTEELRRQIELFLLPGDVLVTRHDRAVTNLFLPGYWPHAALYVGTEKDRQRMGIEIDQQRLQRWTGRRTVLEALKDGVLFRPLDETLSVDAVAVIRPQLAEEEIANAIGRACVHEGKLYNFDFDFFRSDRLVCTEVVYRAYDGVGPIKMSLNERNGRPTLSAEDLLDLALAGRGFDTVAVCGTPASPDDLIVGTEASRLVRESYRGTVS